MENNETLKVCEHCLMAIESREGNQPTLKHYIDADDTEVTCIMENADIKKIDKIIDGILDGKINKSNLYDEVRKFTKRITSDHSIHRWQIITEWFDTNMEL